MQAVHPHLALTPTGLLKEHLRKVLHPGQNSIKPSESDSDHVWKKKQTKKTTENRCTVARMLLRAIGVSGSQVTLWAGRPCLGYASVLEP